MDDAQIEKLVRPLLQRFHDLENIMSGPGFHQNPAFSSLSREHRSLSERLEKVNAWKALRQEKEHLREMMESADPEFSGLARAEWPQVQEKYERCREGLFRILVPPDPRDDKNIVLEIRAGTGGEEAALFAADLARMYLRFAQDCGFEVETADTSLAAQGGYKEAVFFVNARPGQKAETGPFGQFKFESGVHRVQRVPLTEASGRIHTSTITVAVLPEAEDVDVEVRPQDLRIDTYRASGAGGQHVNKTDSAVRMTHLPTGIVVQCQDERSQQKNRVRAMKLLKAKLFEIARENQEKSIASDRKKQVGTGERSEKIRTYNFPQDRITDHRIGLSVHNLEEILNGRLESLVAPLRDHEKREKCENLLKESA